MKRRNSDGWYQSSPKKPPPDHGLRIKKAGTTWWGQRWIEALEVVLSGDSGRLARGKTYARAGRTHDLVVERGRVTAKVTGSRATPYEISIRLTPLAAAAWQLAIDGMAKKAQFSAELLAGQMPRQIDDVFREAGVSLFPKQREDLETSCSCPDWGDPCKHVAAAHYVLGEALDRDPFLLFELRGKTKTQVLDALRSARGGTSDAAAQRGTETKTKTKSKTKTKRARELARAEVPSVKVGKLEPAAYDRPREALPALHFMFDEPAAPGAVLRQLGTPATWQNEASPADVLAPLVRAAAEAARRLALTESDGAEGLPTATPAPPPSAPPRRRRVQQKRAPQREGKR
ncbi:MAG TPA: SWIM zinc finger family protein [Polyangiaceae bacterium]|nr:SWIM zinc finger family protein [Polyangiaceae bacterium]